MIIVLECLAALIVFGIVVMIIDNHRFVVREYSLSSKKVKGSVKMVLITDLHEKRYGKNEDRVLDAIAKERPDVIVIGGDMITASKAFAYKKKSEKTGQEEMTEGIPSWFYRSYSLLRELAKRYPVYYVYGNHEMKLSFPERMEEFGNTAEEYEKYLSKLPVMLMNNRSLPFPGHPEIEISGLVIERFYYRKFKNRTMEDDYVQSVLGHCDSSKYQILLTHNPKYFPAYAAWGADLVLAGHVHGGIVRLPFVGGVISPGPSLFPKYSGGLYEEKSSQMVLSCGLGMHTLPVRMFNPAEISVITVTNTENK